MSEQPPPDRPSEPPKPGTWDTMSEQDLDEALSRASSLASDLSEQLSAPQERTPGESRNPLDVDRENLDREMSQLGDLVSTAAKEIDAPSGDTGDDGAGSEVPDFMAEFMSPEPSSAAAVPAGATILDDLSASPAEVAASKLPASMSGVVGAPINITIPAVGGRRSADASPTSAERPERSKLEEAENEPSLGILAPLAGLLTLLDRPFGWAGPRVRLAAGIAGMLILAAAVLVLARGGK